VEANYAANAAVDAALAPAAVAALGEFPTELTDPTRRLEGATCEGDGEEIKRRGC
jgi:hypothetical protein